MMGHSVVVPAMVFSLLLTAGALDLTAGALELVCDDPTRFFFFFAAFAFSAATRFASATPFVYDSRLRG